MSLMDGLLLDNLLQNVMKQDVWLANRTDSVSTGGQGTELDPYEAKGTSSPGTNDLPFDRILREIRAKYEPLGEGVTIRLLPGTYYTRGFNAGHASDRGWRAFSKLRIVGTSLESTKLVRVGTPVAGATAVIGVDQASYGTNFLNGFEMSDVSIDCAYSSGATDAAFCGVMIFGKNIFLRRVAVTNFGTTSNTHPGLGLRIANAASGAGPADNCVLDSCSASAPGGTNSTSGVYGIYLASAANGQVHYFSTVRNCFVDLGQSETFSSKYIGIAAGGGKGLILEHNRVLNCQKAITLPNDNSSSLTDLIIRHNYCRDVADGIALSLGSGTFNRLIAWNNVVEWAKASGSGVDAPTGITLLGAGTFSNVIIRDNLMRRIDLEAPGNAIGVELQNWTKAIVDNNIIDIGILDKGIRHPNLTSAKFKPFNNLKPDGTLVRAYNTSTSIYDSELTTDVEDVVLGI